MRTLYCWLSLLLALPACGGGSDSSGAGGGAAASGTGSGSGSGTGSGAGSGSGTGSGSGAGGGVIHPPPPPPVACTPPIKPADVSKPTTVIGTGEGSCTEAKLDAALVKGGVITFDCGKSATLTVTKTKTVSVTTVIDGGGEVTLDAGGKTRIFLTQGDVDFTVQNLTLKGASVGAPRGNGPADVNSGAAIYRQSNGKLEVIDCTFEGGSATDTGGDIGGGAIFSYGGDTVIVGSTFSGNSGSNGGAIGNLRSNLTIVNSSFANNVAKGGNGGAVYLDGQNMDHGKVFTLCGVVMTNNTAAVEAGAVYRYGYPGESSVIDASTFDSNTATDPMGGLGGGLYVQTDTPGAMPLTITNSTISNNTAGRGAGGIFLYNVPTTFTNVTIANNIAQTSLGGGVAANGVKGTFENCTIAGNHADHPDSFAGGITGGTVLTLINTIVANNTAGNAYNPVSCNNTCAGGDHDMQFPKTESSGQMDTPCVSGIDFADPMLGPLADNGGPTKTMQLMSGSPAIGAGAGCPKTDQRGASRSGGCDLGATQHGPLK